MKDPGCLHHVVGCLCHVGRIGFARWIPGHLCNVALGCRSCRFRFMRPLSLFLCEIWSLPLRGYSYFHYVGLVCLCYRTFVTSVGRLQYVGHLSSWLVTSSTCDLFRLNLLLWFCGTFVVSAIEPLSLQLVASAMGPLLLQLVARFLGPLSP